MRFVRSVASLVVVMVVMVAMMAVQGHASTTKCPCAAAKPPAPVCACAQAKSVSFMNVTGAVGAVGVVPPIVSVPKTDMKNSTAYTPYKDPPGVAHLSEARKMARNEINIKTVQAGGVTESITKEQKKHTKTIAHAIASMKKSLKTNPVSAVVSGRLHNLTKLMDGHFRNQGFNAAKIERLHAALRDTRNQIQGLHTHLQQYKVQHTETEKEVAQEHNQLKQDIAVAAGKARVDATTHAALSAQLSRGLQREKALTAQIAALKAQSNTAIKNEVARENNQFKSAVAHSDAQTKQALAILTKKYAAENALKAATLKKQTATAAASNKKKTKKTTKKTKHTVTKKTKKTNKKTTTTTTTTKKKGHLVKKTKALHSKLATLKSKIAAVKAATKTAKKATKAIKLKHTHKPKTSVSIPAVRSGIHKALPAAIVAKKKKFF